jgi:hypothetical protein
VTRKPPRCWTGRCVHRGSCERKPQDRSVSRGRPNSKSETRNPKQTRMTEARMLKAAASGAPRALPALARAFVAVALLSGGPRFVSAALAPDPLGWRLGVAAWSFKNFTFHEAIDRTAVLGLRYLEAAAPPAGTRGQGQRRQIRRQACRWPSVCGHQRKPRPPVVPVT